MKQWYNNKFECLKLFSKFKKNGGFDDKPLSQSAYTSDASHDKSFQVLF